jgi:uncharacterized protein YdeI (YjbR/CyaY-like superfamily)
MKPNIDAQLFANQRAWEAWLRINHRISDGLWLLLAKKGSSRKSLGYIEAVESALCFGWIDGQKRALDDDFWLQRFTPRRPRSVWSKVNRTRVLALIAQGRMKAPGLEQVERAKADGRWDDAYEPASTAKVPPDLQTALDGNAKARDFFATLDGANRYSVLWRVQTAKKADTRAKRIATYIEMLARKEKPHP